MDIRQQVTLGLVIGFALVVIVKYEKPIRPIEPEVFISQIETVLNQEKVDRFTKASIKTSEVQPALIAMTSTSEPQQLDVDSEYYQPEDPAISAENDRVVADLVRHTEELSRQEPTSIQMPNGLEISMDEFRRVKDAELADTGDANASIYTSRADNL